MARTSNPPAAPEIELPFARTAAVLVAGMLVAASAALIATPAHAATVNKTDRGMTFTADSANVAAGATITSYNQSVGGPTPVIPDTVEIGADTYKVTVIGDSAFERNSLTAVTIGNNVVTIDDYAFYRNFGLTALTIPDSVVTIGQAAFHSNAALETLSIGNSVVAIGGYAFYNTALTTLAIPGSVTSIGEYAFFSTRLTMVVIPASVTSIGQYAFKDLDPETPLTDVVFLGPPPTTFSAAGAGGSFGTGDGLTVHYHAAHAGPGGFVSPTWQGYQAIPGPVATFALGGHGASIAPVDLHFNTTLSVPAAPAASGWTLTGWYADSALSIPFSFTALVTADVTLYAGWDADPALAATGSALTLPLSLAGILVLLAGAFALIRSRRTA